MTSLPSREDAADVMTPRDGDAGTPSCRDWCRTAGAPERSPAHRGRKCPAAGVVAAAQDDTRRDLDGRAGGGARWGDSRYHTRPSRSLAESCEDATDQNPGAVSNETADSATGDSHTGGDALDDSLRAAVIAQLSDRCRRLGVWERVRSAAALQANPGTHVERWWFLVTGPPTTEFRHHRLHVRTGGRIEERCLDMGKSRVRRRSARNDPQRWSDLAADQSWQC